MEARRNCLASFSPLKGITMRITAYDFETTGVNPNECEPVQLAALAVTIHEDGTYTKEGEGFCEILNCENGVPEGAFKVHGISTEQVQASTFCPRKVVGIYLRGVVLGYNNNSYDNIIAKRYGADITDSVDLFTAVSRLKKEGVLAKASLSYAYEHFTGKNAENAHDALADVEMTLELIPHLMAQLKIETFSELRTWLATPRGSLDAVWPIGKHKGKLVCNLPPSYVTWALENMAFMDPDLRECLYLYQEAQGNAV